MAWKFENETPIYLQIMDKIKRDIASGILSPGSKIPPVRELAIEAGVNPNTMQKALQTLEIEGILYSQRTSGRFVAESVNESVRENICEDVLKKFVEHMYELGFNEKDIVTKLEDYLKKSSKNAGGY
ncbi:MAG: GntR family transcriptional regulator [Eubacterium sp.]|nr:GntR family transcriptional regulator [Eubacterium sp.]